MSLSPIIWNGSWLTRLHRLRFDSYNAPTLKNTQSANRELWRNTVCRSESWEKKHVSHKQYKNNTHLPWKETKLLATTMDNSPTGKNITYGYIWTNGIFYVQWTVDFSKIVIYCKCRSLHHTRWAPDPSYKWSYGNPKINVRKSMDNWSYGNIWKP